MASAEILFQFPTCSLGRCYKPSRLRNRVLTLIRALSTLVQHIKCDQKTFKEKKHNSPSCASIVGLKAAKIPHSKRFAVGSIHLAYE